MIHTLPTSAVTVLLPWTTVMSYWRKSTEAFYALIITLISMHTAVLRPGIQDAMANVTTPGTYEVTWP